MARFIPALLARCCHRYWGGYKDFKNLPYACSLCTACDDVCPVRIPLSSLILQHRRTLAEGGMTPAAERGVVRLFNYANRHPGLWKVGMVAGARAAQLMIRNGKMPFNIAAIRKWTEARDLPDGDGESFRSWFKKHQRQCKDGDNA